MNKNLKVGTVTHYFDKIGVAVLQLSAPLAIGDRVRFEKSGFTQTVTSMQIEHVAVTSAKKGKAIGLKTDNPVKSGEDVFKEKS
jgi:hypothetical protein